MRELKHSAFYWVRFAAGEAWEPARYEDPNLFWSFGSEDACSVVEIGPEIEKPEGLK